VSPQRWYAAHTVVETCGSVRSSKEAAGRAAALDQRTLSSLVVHLLTQYCREAGTLKARR
jgi:hypothetical protein